MAKLLPYMKKRGSKYAVRVPVPNAIQGILDRVEITRTLKTSDLIQAKKNYHDVMAEINKVFEQARLKLENPAPASLVGFYPLAAVKAWYHIKRTKIASSGKGGFVNGAEQENHILGLKSDLVELTASKSRRYAFVGFTAFSLLEKAGYPMKPDTSVPNIDFDDPKYISLLDHLVAATIELREFELEVLGQKISHIPNGGIYLQPVQMGPVNAPIAISNGTSIAALIKKYMVVKGSNGKQKSIDDKYAAYAYLTDLVGESFLVENLTNDHFFKIRSLLSAFPKNANKLKVLKGKNLHEKSQYAQANNLPLMSKQNANKIIARLKALMQYAVSVDLLNKNPCTELEFPISQAEKAASQKEKFSDQQLTKLFHSKAYGGNYPCGAAMYWAPIIALFHGMRMEEILILTLNEIKFDDKSGTHFFDLTGFTTDTLKNQNAIRRVPLHKELKNLGFYDYLKKCEKHKGKRLFPELKKSKGKDQTYRKRFSQVFSRYSKKVGVYSNKTVFHSFRRNFASACLDGKVPTEYENCLAGWALSGGQKGTYKSPKDASISVLREMMDKVEYPNLDLSHLYPNN